MRGKISIRVKRLSGKSKQPKVASSKLLGGLLDPKPITVRWVHGYYQDPADLSLTTIA
ncbi:MAG: hypothetical protein ABW172_12180 [Candidatus Binatia bacterium]